MSKINKIRINITNHFHLFLIAMYRLFLLFTFIISAVVLFTQCFNNKLPELQVGDYHGLKNHLNKKIAKEMKKKKIPGVSIALVDDAKIVWQRGYGFSNTSNQVAATANTLYRVGSLSKLIAVLGAMKLIDEGKLSLNAPVTKYLPNFSVKARFPLELNSITIKTLMNHHAGLPYGIIHQTFSDTPLNSAQLLIAIADEYLSHPPGTVYRYSNMGINVLGLVIEKVTGVPFTTYIEDNILKPMGMTNSHYSLKRAHKEGLANGYLKGNSHRIFPVTDVSAAGLFTTVADYSKFIKLTFAEGLVKNTNDVAKRLIKANSVNAMLKRQNQGVPLDLDYSVGLGWLLTGPPDMEYTHHFALHDGGTPYFHSMVVILPKYKLGVVVFANAASGIGIVHSAAFDAIKLALQVKHGVVAPSLNETIKVIESHNANLPPQDAATAEKLQGTYDTPIGIINIKKMGNENKLSTSLFGINFVLTPSAFVHKNRANGIYHIKPNFWGIPLPINFLNAIRVGFINVNESAIRQEDFTRLFMQVPAPNNNKMIFKKMGVAVKIDNHYPISEAWSKRMGKYKTSNQGNLPVIIKDISLHKKVSNNSDYPTSYLSISFRITIFNNSKVTLSFKPLSDTEAFIQGLGIIGGERLVVTTAQDGSEKILFSGYELVQK